MKYQPPDFEKITTFFGISKRFVQKNIIFFCGFKNLHHLTRKACKKNGFENF